MTTPNEQNAKKVRYCLKKCLKEKSLSSNVHTLFSTKFVVIDTIMPTKVACRYHTFDTTFARRYETIKLIRKPLAPTVKNLPALDKKRTDLCLFCSTTSLAFCNSFDFIPYR